MVPNLHLGGSGSNPGMGLKYLSVFSSSVTVQGIFYFVLCYTNLNNRIKHDNIMDFLPFELCNIENDAKLIYGRYCSVIELPIFLYCCCGYENRFELKERFNIVLLNV